MYFSNKFTFSTAASCHYWGNMKAKHDDVIIWKHFPRYWPFVWGIHRSPVNSPHKGQWRGALMFSLICVWINGWGNNREYGDLRRYCAHYDVIVMKCRHNKYVLICASAGQYSIQCSSIVRHQFKCTCMCINKTFYLVAIAWWCRIY